MVQPVERFSERANRVIDVADDEARRLDHPYIGTEHLLLGLIADEGPTGVALIAAGATTDAARDKAAEAVGRGDPRQRGSLEYSKRARRAIERASKLSLQRRDAHVEPEHLLIGVLDVEGRAGQVLRGLGVDVASLRASIDQPGEVIHAKPAPVDKKSAEPQCAVCGMALAHGAAYRKVEAAAGDGKGHRDVVVVYCSSCGTALGVTG